VSKIHFEMLFSPLSVGPMRVPNRICETTNSIGNMFPDDAFIAHHAAKARGGTGWIGSETWLLNVPLPPELPDEFNYGAAAVRFAPYQMPEFVSGIERFCREVHEAGAVAVFQLTHMNNAFAASPVPITEIYDLVPHELNEVMIDSILNTYADAAAVAHAAGADGVEIHCAHESTPQTFLSPALNHRTDRWGGPPDHRIRFVVEALERIRGRVGKALALGIRVNGEESRVGGYDHVQMREMTYLIGETGLLDFINIDVGHCFGTHAYIAPSYYGNAHYREFGKAARADLGPKIPVLFTGRINDPVVAEELLRGGYCDLVGMTRAGIADPEFANKARSGRLIEIRRCIACNRCIDEALNSKRPDTLKRPLCSVNPIAGNEQRWAREFRRAAISKHVVIVGGGAAGLEAARVSAMRGHRVTLCERGVRVGGQLLLTSKTPGRDSFEDQVYFQENELQRLGVDVRVNTSVDVEEIKALKPDAVVVATGSTPRYPMHVPGIELPHVVNGWDAVLGKVALGQRVAVISREDHFETPSIALFIAAKGKVVEVFHGSTHLGHDIERYSIGAVMQRVEEYEIPIHPNLILTEITAVAIRFVSSYARKSVSVGGFDSVVLVYGSVPNAQLYHALCADTRIAQPYIVGSAWTPRGIAEATRDGANVGLVI